jgi:hypothetical protein
MTVATLFVFDHRLSPQIGKIAIGSRAEFLLEHFVANLFNSQRIALGFFEQTANICMPSDVCSGGVKWPTSAQFAKRPRSASASRLRAS